MLPSKSSIASIYNPKIQSQDELIDRFVVRQELFEKLFREIKEAEMKFPEQHYLIEGKRGMGKTALLLRLCYAIERDQQGAQTLIPLV
ncbi:MAG: ATPase, partial [Bacteroidota bacterium]